MKNKVTFKHTQHRGKIAQHRKENKGLADEYSVLAPDKTYGQHAVIIARLYWAGNTAHACVWINSSKAQVWISGGGRASGYGYHKASAALQAALDDAGVQGLDNIAGRGESAMTDALAAIASFTFTTHMHRGIYV